MEDAIVRFIDENRKFIEDKPLCLLVAESEGRFIGKLRGSFNSEGLYYIVNIEVGQNKDFNEIGKALIEYAIQNLPDIRIEAASWDKLEDQALESLYKSNGFHIYFEKAYYKKDIADYKSDYSDPF